MYEHPIKRAGLSFNRILYSNTKMVAKSFPKVDAAKFETVFRYRVFENGKPTMDKCKSQKIR